MEGKSETETLAIAAQTKGQDEAKKVCDDAWARADKVYKEAKQQAEIVYLEAKKIAVDKEAKQAADKAHKVAQEQAKKLREAIIAEGMAVFRVSYDKATTDYEATALKSKEALRHADEAHKEAKQQADKVYQEAKKIATDKQGKQEADKAYKAALEQAKQVRDEATGKLR